RRRRDGAPALHRECHGRSRRLAGKRKALQRPPSAIDPGASERGAVGRQTTYGGRQGKKRLDTPTPLPREWIDVVENKWPDQNRELLSHDAYDNKRLIRSFPQSRLLFSV